MRKYKKMMHFHHGEHPEDRTVNINCFGHETDKSCTSADEMDTTESSRKQSIK